MEQNSCVFFRMAIRTYASVKVTYTAGCSSCFKLCCMPDSISQDFVQHNLHQLPSCPGLELPQYIHDCYPALSTLPITKQCSPQFRKMSALACKSIKAQRPQVATRKSVVVRADGAFLGSTTNLIMCASTGACLAAARFGLAPTVKKPATPGLKLVPKKDAAGLMSGDPAGFTAVDVLSMGSAGHAIGVGIVLGLKGIGAL